jgi:hypothetical protein
MNAWLWAPLALSLFALVVVPTSVGKLRKPMTGGAASTICLIQLGTVFCLLKAGGVL